MEFKKELYQYEHTIPAEYAKFAIFEMAKAMNIEFEEEKFIKFRDAVEPFSEECVCIMRDKNEEDCFIMLDKNPPDYYFGITVRCTKNEMENVKKAFISTLNSILAIYGHELIDDVKNFYYDTNNYYNEVLKKLNVNFI